MYDIIGDVHGHLLELEGLLKNLGYKKYDDYYRHKNRKAIFLGDLIDRGPAQEGVVNLVRTMVKQGAAMAVMGNHEYNAIAYYTADTAGNYLRKRNEQNTAQHQKFLDVYQDRPSDWHEAIAWFKTLPLWLDLTEFRIVHACWDQTYIDKILAIYNNSATLSEECLRRSSNEETWEFKAIETILKGPELPLPGGVSFRDKEGQKRYSMRTQWWKSASTYKEGYIGPEVARASIPDVPIDGDYAVGYGVKEKPVFIGHYWLSGVPAVLAKNVVCVDYSVAKPNGKLVAYRLQENTSIDASGFTSFERVG